MQSNNANVRLATREEPRPINAGHKLYQRDQDLSMLVALGNKIMISEKTMATM